LLAVADRGKGSGEIRDYADAFAQVLADDGEGKGPASLCAARLEFEDGRGLCVEGAEEEEGEEKTTGESACPTFR
jgi:predicted NUDIX family NTP pyrophosphohydrolase